MRNFSNLKRVIIKVGSSSLVKKDLSINIAVIDTIMNAFKNLMDKGIGVALVTSGAIAVGMHELKLNKKPSDIAIKQACAAVGQAKLMEAYNIVAERYGLVTGQVLVSHDDFQYRKRMLCLSDSLDAMFKNNIIPIINENDALAVEEIKVGDNDTLSALISPMIHAELLILFSDIDGLFDKNPKENIDAKLISTVNKIDDSIYAMVGKKTSNIGTGGMETKLNAAIISTMAGSNMIICNSNKIDKLADIIAGEEIGTLFIASNTKISSREHWIIFKTNSVGKVIVDDGVKGVFLKGKVSLLPKGIIGVDGDFFKGSVIDVVTKDGEIIAKGIASLSSIEIRKVLGVNTKIIKDVLGYNSKHEVIHANDLVLMEDEYGKLSK